VDHEVKPNAFCRSAPPKSVSSRDHDSKRMFGEIDETTVVAFNSTATVGTKAYR
jgi:hypothetical protein